MKVSIKKNLRDGSLTEFLVDNIHRTAIPASAKLVISLQRYLIGRAWLPVGESMMIVFDYFLVLNMS